MTNPNLPYQGQCLCGSIKYQIDALEPNIGHCHCSMCRKFHGAAFATYGKAKSTNFHWLEGENQLNSFKADNGTVRQFCQNCGSSLTFAGDDGESDVVVFALATLDSEIEQKPVAHIYTNFKANWYDINDDLLKYREDRDSDLLINQ